MLGAPREQQVSKEVATNLILFEYASSPIDVAAKTAADYREVVFDFSGFALIPIFEMEFQNRSDISSIFSEYEVLLADKSDHGLTSLHRWCCFQLLGSPEEAKDHMRGITKFLETQERIGFGVASQILPVARRMSGELQISNDAALKACETNHALVHVACWLGIEALTNGRREEAKQLFEQVVATNGYHWNHYRWAELFLERIDDPEWLSWLENDGSLEPQPEPKE